ncbi:hypothetical protein OY671_012090, partial [Metschnikowia pulcherrima]
SAAHAGLSRCRKAGRGRDDPDELSAAGLCGRSTRAEGRAGESGRGQGFPAPGRGSRRKLCRVPSEHDSRHVPRAAADGGGADLRQQAAGGKGRPHGRAVRQAALLAGGSAGRRGTAQLPRR